MQKQLYRSRKNKIISGVAGGLAEYFDIDPVIIRILFVLATIAWGVSLLAYILLWIIVPVEKLEPIQEFQSEPQKGDYIPVTIEYGHKKTRRKAIAGIILIVLGIVIFFDNIYPWFSFHDFWPLLLIAYGVYILLKNFQEQSTSEVK